MNIEHLNPAGLLSYPGLSQIVCTRGGRTAYIAGQSAYNERFELVGSDSLQAQATQALRNLRTAVVALGGTPAHIVSSTVYIKDLTPARSELFSAALAQALDGAPFPAHAFSIIGVAALAGPQQQVEIAAVAVLAD
jgi:enamine deaminase RidA (YjgF/YER057c/UK114 family)